jgi:sortase (surface protein transpeptidase)
VWAGTSGVLAAAAIAAVVVLPQDNGDPVRLDVPLAVAAPPATATATPSRPPAELAGSAVTAPQLSASAPTRVQIPVLGVTSRIMELGLQRDGSMEVPPGAYPVGWYDGSPTPGQLGPAVLAGHVDWEGEPGAFSGLRELRPGDTVMIDRADGSVVTFRVDRVEGHAKDDFPTEDVYGDIDHPGLRLITCGGAFDEDTGDYQDNVIVFASLAAVG